jgi:hypothetical protein
MVTGETMALHSVYIDPQNPKRGDKYIPEITGTKYRYEITILMHI